MEKFKILFVDDEQDFLETIIKRLKARSIDVTGVESGYKALEVLEGRNPDVIILDVKMPGMDGIETLREIKKKNPWWKSSCSPAMPRWNRASRACNWGPSIMS